MLKILTEGVKLRQSAVQDVDGLHSFDFQQSIEACLVDQVTRSIFVNAETGAGKTRAFSLPALKSGTNLLIIAPTNALIHDIRLNVDRICKQIGGQHEVHAITRYALYALKGQVPPSRRPSQGQALLDLLIGEDSEPRKPKVIVTNPDSLAIALQGLYYRSQDVLKEILHRYPWIVFDEFHAYAPKQIPSILFLHALIDSFAPKGNRKSLFSSATPNSRFRRVLQNLLQLPEAGIAEIRADTIADGFQVLQPTQFFFEQRDSEWDTSGLRKYVEAHLQHIRQHLGGAAGEPRRVCIIANSVFEASEITDSIVRAGFVRGRDVEEIRGFLAPGERGRGTLPIVVGTSAIEMGVNFPISMLFTEGSDGAALIQRLGRLGRSNRSEVVEAHAIIPKQVYDALRDLDGRTIVRKMLRQQILDAYPQYEDFWSYVQEFGLYENRFYIQRLEEMNTRHRSPHASRYSPRVRSYLEELLLPQLAKGYGIQDWQAHLQILDDEIEQRGYSTKAAIERLLSTTRGETVPVTCAIYDRADERRGLFPFKVYDGRLLVSRGDIIECDPWNKYDKEGKEYRRPPKWYTDAASKYRQEYPSLWEDHWQEIESGYVQLFVKLNGLKEDRQKVEYETRTGPTGLKENQLYSFDLSYWAEAFGLFEQTDFSEALRDQRILTIRLQYGQYQGALKQKRNLNPLFEVDTLHVGASTYQVAFGINALYVWSQALRGSSSSKAE